MNKLRTIQAAAAALICGLSGAVVAHDGKDGKDCSLRTLKGDYVFSASGHSLNTVTGVWFPKAIVEYIHFNGDGTLSVSAATVANRAGDGAVIRSLPGTGTYVLDVNCTGTLHFSPPQGPSFDIFVAPKGRDLWMIQNTSGNVLQGHVKKVS
jgi:hypothetical protein